MKWIKYSFLLFMGMLLMSCGSTRRTKGTFSNQDKKVVSKYSEMLSTDFQMDNLPLYREVDKWLGTPYQYGQCTPSGADCSGFVYAIYKEVYGITLSRSSVSQFSDCKKVKLKDVKVSDLLFFRLDNSGKISHVGIYLGNQLFAHATVHKGVMIDNLATNYYKKGFTAAGRAR